MDYYFMQWVKIYYFHFLMIILSQVWPREAPQAFSCEPLTCLHLALYSTFCHEMFPQINYK